MNCKACKYSFTDDCEGRSVSDDLQRQIELAAKSRIEALEADIKAMQAEQQRLVAELQCSCSHPDIVELPFEDSTWCSHAKPPVRVCKTCGLCEQGWGCGHQLLHLGDKEYVVRLTKITHEEFYKLRRGKLWENHEFVERGRTPVEILREKLGVVG